MAASNEYPNLNIHVVDLDKIHAGEPKKLLGDPDFSLDQGHLSSLGHKKLAKDILDALSRIDWKEYHWLHPLRDYNFFYGDIDE